MKKLADISLFESLGSSESCSSNTVFNRQLPKLPYSPLKSALSSGAFSAAGSAGISAMGGPACAIPAAIIGGPAGALWGGLASYFGNRKIKKQVIEASKEVEKSFDALVAQDIDAVPVHSYLKLQKDHENGAIDDFQYGCMLLNLYSHGDTYLPEDYEDENYLDSFIDPKTVAGYDQGLWDSLTPGELVADYDQEGKRSYRIKEREKTKKEDTKDKEPEDKPEEKPEDKKVENSRRNKVARILRSL